MDKSAEKWKDKYLASLEDLDVREKEWQDVEKVLRRCISRLSLIGDSSNTKLDDQLERLRNSVRGERNLQRLQRMVDGIVETATEDSSGFSAVEAIHDLIESVNWPAGLGKGVTRLRKALTKRDAQKELGTHIQTLTSLLNDAIKLALAEPMGTAKQEQEKEKTGLLSSLFGKSTGGEEVIVHSEEITSVEERDDLLFASKLLLELLGRMRLSAELQNIVARLKDRARDLETHQALNDVLSDIAHLVSENAVNGEEIPPDEVGLEIHEVLIQLVEKLHVPEEMQEHADNLKSQWEYGIEEDKVVEALERIADLVIDIRMRIEKERSELQDFLQQLTSQLDVIDEHIQEELNEQRQAFETNRQFGDAVNGQMRDIRTDVSEATELNDLKEVVSTRLMAIQKHMDSFKEREERRNEKMEERVEQLNERLHTMEQESEQLKEKIAEEQQNAVRDALTGVPNRLGWNQRMELEYARWLRYKTPLSLIVWDIDDFKKVNDTYGHKAGDKVLTTVAHILRDKVRTTDYLARFGGEEFVVLLPETKGEDAVTAAEKIRKAIEACEFHHGDKPVPITASAGITEFKKGDTEESVFERADKYLYTAKRSGKNRCISDNNK